MMRALPKTPLTAKSGNANMPPYDKQNAPRPRMPVAAKAPSSSPLTPRVAVASSREDLSTPVSAFLSVNITPRSGSRKSRVDSPNTTPSGTPTGTPAPPASDPLRGYEPLPHLQGLGMSGTDKDGPRRPMVSFSPPISDTHSRGSGQSNMGDSSKFFFASDAKTAQASKPPPPTKSASNFFYANGDSIPAPPSSGASAVGSSVGDERAQPRFFHANGTPDLQASPHFLPSRPSSTVSTAPRVTNNPRLAGSNTLSPPSRPTSPSKQLAASTSPLRGTLNVTSSPLPRPQTGVRGQSANAIISPPRTSTETAERVISHGRSSSLSSADSIAVSRRVSSGSSFPESPTSPQNLVTSSARLSTPEGIPEEVEPPTEDIPSGLQSPIKTGHSLEHMNELAANARRERKVLDLEITNSSLAAINRTLEREMRKQTAELRRYRRLSRSGRLSIATSASVRTSNALSSINGEDVERLSDMSEEESEEISDLDSSEEDSFDDGSLDPAALAASDLRHRKKDEKRLQLDLSKHQQLLIDSQKMNESLKRCLGWTEGLIAEGRKALEYKVHVSDVELGGRVLITDYEHDAAARGGGALLPHALTPDADAWTGTGEDRTDVLDAIPDEPPP